MRPTLLSTITLLTACAKEAPDAVWAAEHTTSDASVHGIWGSGAEDVWAVGGDTDGGRAWRRQGSAWAEVELPEGAPTMRWAWGTSADDVWMVGERGGAFRWNGTTVQPFLTGSDQDMFGIWGRAANDIWLVGGDIGGDIPAILWTDGVRVERHLLGALANPRQATSLFKVWGVGNTVFAVGENGLIIQWGGEEWGSRPSGELADEDFTALTGTSGDDMITVGGQTSARLARWDGVSWTSTRPDAPALGALWVQADGTAHVGGHDGYLAALTRSDVFTADIAVTDLDVGSLWGDDAGALYAVAASGAAPHRGVILRRDVD